MRQSIFNKLSHITLAVCAVIFLATTPGAYAQTPQVQGINLTLSPTFINLVTDPGEEVSGVIKITNNSSFPENLRIDIAKFDAAEGGARPLISEMTEEDRHKDWVVFSEEAFVVGAGATKSITFIVTPDETASLGYYYAFVVNREQGTATTPQGASIAGAPAALALLEVRSPDAKREMNIVEFKTDKWFYEYLPSEITVKVKNKGNVHLFPVGEVFVDSMFNKNIGVLHVNEARGNVLPNTEREFTMKWEDGFAVSVPKRNEKGAIIKDDKGNVISETSYDFAKANKFRFGKYTATIVMAYDNGERDVPMEATVSFWIVPWKILGIGTVVVLFALLGLKNTFISSFQRLRKSSHDN